MKKIAKKDEFIEAKNGIVGKVEKVNENSVIVKIIENPTENDYGNSMTVINHKHYKIIKNS